MNIVVAVLASLGGIGVVGGAARSIVKAISRQVRAVDSNTDALNRLTAQVNGLDAKVDDHSDRLARLEGRSS